MVRILDKYDFPEQYHYSEDHMWAKVEDRKVRIGLTDFGQQIAGKILMVRPRPLGKKVAQGRILGTMETGKWVGPLRSPVSGTIVEFNEALRVVKTADLVNKDPYGAGWMFVLEPTDLEDDLKNLVSDPMKIEEWLREEIARIEAEQ